MSKCYPSLMQKSEAYEQTTATLEESLQVEPDDIRTQHRLGIIYLNRGAYEQAEAHFKKCVLLKPDCAEAYSGLGMCYNSLNAYKKAVRAIKKAIRLRPDYAGAYFTLGGIYMNKGHLHNMGRICQGMSRGFNGRDLICFRKAIVLFKKSIRLDPDFTEAYYHLGCVYDELKDYRQAIASYRKVIRLEPGHIEAYAHLAFDYGRLGDKKMKMTAYQKAIRIEPDNKEITWVYHNIGIAYRQDRNYTKAIKAFKKIISIDPSDIDAYYELCFTYKQMGDNSSALDACKRMIRVRTYSRHYSGAKLIDVPLSEVDFGDYEKALNLLKDVIHANPDDAGAHYYLGVAYLKESKLTEALKEYAIVRKLNRALAERLNNLMKKHPPKGH